MQAQLAIVISQIIQYKRTFLNYLKRQSWQMYQFHKCSYKNTFQNCICTDYDTLHYIGDKRDNYALLLIAQVVLEKIYSCYIDSIATYSNLGYKPRKFTSATEIFQFFLIQTSVLSSGLCYKPMTIVNDDSRVINKLEASLTDNTTVIIYDCHMFIVQATDQ